ncbi:MAG: phosphoadenylyl-sulfate reductase [Myxococcales bacterium]|nr:phosphoadenylyl-sulfate reductase [Myxococcales bacterium]
MHITMVKKRLANGDTCEKCAQAEEMLRRRGYWDGIDEVVWAIEGDDSSPGAQLGKQHGVEIAPFFLLRDDDASVRVVKSALQLAQMAFAREPAAEKAPSAVALDCPALDRQFANAEPQAILRFALERFGNRCALAFSGAEGVVLIDMATQLGLPFRVFTVDSGRLHDETYAYLDDVQHRFGVSVRAWLPDAEDLGALLAKKGPNSFYRDGHAECCEIRRTAPLRRALLECEAWVTSDRRDVSEEGASLPTIREDPTFRGAADVLIQVNPLAAWSRARVWRYISEHGVPYNELHDQGYVDIGCRPCVRPMGGIHGKRETRWWWEKREPPGDLHESGDGI